MEIWDIYDENRIKKDKTMVRGHQVEAGDYHLVVHVCIFNEKGEMLIQQRQPFKQGWSNLWDITCGGSAVKGDSSQQAATRELEEEIGYYYDFTGHRPTFTINFHEGFDDIYIIEAEVDLTTLTLQASEVQRVKWATKEEIFEKLHHGEFIPYYEHFLGLLFELKTKFGCIRK
ncbi:MAG: NUDIX domain-containing protein [Clostridia bacterium]|nr:NUDIX domain-containing protein [Clostridia bacterium]